jgi:hypothetical protein
MKKFSGKQGRTVLIGLVGFAIGSLGAISVVAQESSNSGPPGGGKGGPPPQMLKICVGKAMGDACSAKGPNGQTVTGTCGAPEGRPLACRPRGAGSNGKQSSPSSGKPEAQ